MWKWKLVVKKTGRTWGVFDEVSGDLVEGGFFRRSAAEQSLRDWEKQLSQETAEDAERAAGWDPNP